MTLDRKGNEMKTTINLGVGLLALLLCSACHAQQQTTQYVPIMEKRADLRMQYIQATGKAATEAANKPATAEPSKSTLDRSRMVDFVNKLPKRAELRVRVNAIGIEAAYAEWMAQGHH
jgi:cytochrome c553